MVGVTDPVTGKFVKGNKVGGRRKRPTEERYLELFKQTVKQDDLVAIINRAVSDAKRGDATARKFLFDYLVGPPVERSESDNVTKVTLHVKYDG